jgi:anti-sigma B factor antagonist
MIKIDSKVEERFYELKIGGEVDASSSLHLDTALNEALSSNESVLVNLEELDYISSAGLGVFMSHLQDIDADQKKLIIFGMMDKVYQVFEILGLDQLMTIVKTKDEAIERLKDA